MKDWDKYTALYVKNILTTELYFIGNSNHRLNGPAIIEYSDGKINYEHYVCNHITHNLNGPAIIYYNVDGSIRREVYVLFGIGLTKEQFYDEEFKQSFILLNS